MLRNLSADNLCAIHISPRDGFRWYLAIYAGDRERAATLMSIHVRQGLMRPPVGNTLGVRQVYSRFRKILPHNACMAEVGLSTHEIRCKWPSHKFIYLECLYHVLKSIRSQSMDVPIQGSQVTLSTGHLSEMPFSSSLWIPSIPSFILGAVGVACSHNSLVPGLRRLGAETLGTRAAVLASPTLYGSRLGWPLGERIRMSLHTKHDGRFTLIKRHSNNGVL